METNLRHHQSGHPETERLHLDSQCWMRGRLRRYTRWRCL